MADASVLGINPPATVRVNLDGWQQDWPWDCVDVHGDELVISVPLTHRRRRVVFYPYEHAREIKVYDDDGMHSGWLFHGSEDFFVTPGPPQPLSYQ